MGDRLTLETADVEWLPSSEPGSMLIAYVGLYRVHLGHDGECWVWRLDLLGEQSERVEMFDGANGLMPGSLGKAQARAVEVALLLSELVEGVDVRACRARLPASDDAPQNTGGFGGTHMVLPPGWELDTTTAGEWRVTDTDDAVDLTGPDAEELARSAWKHWARGTDIPRDYTVSREQLERLLGVILGDDQVAYCMDPVSTVSEVGAAIAAVDAMRGPTEGASDAGKRWWADDGENFFGVDDEAAARVAAADAVTDALCHAVGDNEWPEHVERIAWGYAVVVGEAEQVQDEDGCSNWFVSERPPTGEARPGAARWAAEARDASRETRRVQARLDTLIGAVVAIEQGLGSAETTDRNRCLAALAAAKGDAPRAWTEEERTRAAWGDALDLDSNGAPYTVALLSSETERLTGSASAPQLPDSPPVQHAMVTHVGEIPVLPNAVDWWWIGRGSMGLADRPVHVAHYTSLNGALGFDSAAIGKVGLTRVVDWPDWGGRCTRALDPS